MWKKWLAFSIFLPLFSTHAFFDIAAEDPDRHIFEHLQDTKIMNAYPDGNFHPDKLVTRAEALAISLRSGGIVLKPETKNVYFDDVDLNTWYAPIIRRAIDTKVISLQNKQFRPDDYVTKAEFLTFLLRATQVKLDPYNQQTKNIALDIPEQSWFAPEFGYAKQFQIAELPADQYYRPNKFLSRREVAVITFRQLRLFYGDSATKALIEIQSQLQQFLMYLQNGQEDMAAAQLERITELNQYLTRVKSNQDTVSANAIARSLNFFSESLQDMKKQKNLEALENLNLAAKQAQRASEKSVQLAPFANNLAMLITQTLNNFNAPHYENLALIK